MTLPKTVLVFYFTLNYIVYLQPIRMLKLPLHCYDESGRILPPKWLYYLLFSLCIDWLVFVFALVSREQTTQLLTFFYPKPNVLVLGLLTSSPFIIVMLFVSQRERLWKKAWFAWSKWLLSVFYLGVLAAAGLQLTVLATHQWNFDYVSATRLVILCVSSYIIYGSHHIRVMMRDWKLEQVG